MSQMSALEVSHEMFWASYLRALADGGVVTAETPPDEIWKMKAEFMAGIRGDELEANEREGK